MIIPWSVGDGQLPLLIDSPDAMHRRGPKPASSIGLLCTPASRRPRRELMELGKVTFCCRSRCRAEGARGAPRWRRVLPRRARPRGSGIGYFVRSKPTRTVPPRAPTSPELCSSASRTFDGCCVGREYRYVSCAINTSPRELSRNCSKANRSRCLPSNSASPIPGPSAEHLSGGPDRPPALSPDG